MNVILSFSFQPNIKNTIRCTYGGKIRFRLRMEESGKMLLQFFPGSSYIFEFVIVGYVSYVSKSRNASGF